MIRGRVLVFRRWIFFLWVILVRLFVIGLRVGLMW